MCPQEVEEDAAAKMTQVVEADDRLGVPGGEAVQFGFVPEELLALVGKVVQRPGHLPGEPGEPVASLSGSHRDGRLPEVEDALRREGPRSKVGLPGGEDLKLVSGQRLFLLGVVSAIFKH